MDEMSAISDDDIIDTTGTDVFEPEPVEEFADRVDRLIKEVDKSQRAFVMPNHNSVTVKMKDGTFKRKAITAGTVMTITGAYQGARSVILTFEADPMGAGKSVLQFEFSQPDAVAKLNGVGPFLDGLMGEPFVSARTKANRTKRAAEEVVAAKQPKPPKPCEQWGTW